MKRKLLERRSVIELEQICLGMRGTYGTNKM